MIVQHMKDCHTLALRATEEPSPPPFIPSFNPADQQSVTSGVGEKKPHPTITPHVIVISNCEHLG